MTDDEIIEYKTRVIVKKTGRKWTICDKEKIVTGKNKGRYIYAVEYDEDEHFDERPWEPFLYAEDMELIK